MDSSLTAQRSRCSVQLVGNPEVAQFPITVGKRRSRVRLNGADHQWGKDPPKEVVG
jgi:hypothetical protein